ncbi:ATP-binding protein [Kitasatospora purpeofusca]|uniref:ATP-binding protein n=1 Tax=Kitasatospora purpeofusca TaxID=67352 RepID=UPI002A5AC789|nr:ATP-binding protein [Kitasatospora purpeofusca]MDY0815737.1 ATP-binding protein [Kitasatospora purpeofusca]
MTPTQPDRPAVRRVPVALYIATSGEAAAVPLTRHARAFAEARDWTVALTIVDDDPTRPLDRRPGWQVITDALNARTIDGVVTWTRDMVTGGRAVRDARAHDRLPRVLGGGFLAAAVPAPWDGQPSRHATGDPERRRPRTFAARLDSRTEFTPLARYLLRAYLCGLPCGDLYSDTAELLLGELFANAVQHSDAPADRLVEVRFALVRDRLRLEVHDAGTGRPSVRSATTDEEHGRGLLLVNELAERWGCCPRTGDVGKFVWALVAPAPFLSLVTA